MRRLVTLSAVLVSALATALSAVQGPSSSTPSPDAEEVRALWVVRDSLTSAESIERVVTRAAGNGFNTLLVQVRGRGDAYFLGGVEPRAQVLAAAPSFDPLGTILSRAHRAGLQVHAWVSLNLVASATYLPESADHVVGRRPEWLMVPRALSRELARGSARDYVGKLARWTRAQPDVEGLYLSPVIPAAAAYTAAVIEDLVRRYAVDGVHLDYVRYPGPEFDHSPLALAEFATAMAARLDAPERSRVAARARSDGFAWVDAYPAAWADFRRSRLTALVMKLQTVLRAARPELTISAAVLPDFRGAFESRFQDARLWAETGLLDVLCPMAYSADREVFRRQIEDVVRVTSPARVWAGIGAYRLAPEETVAHIAAARAAGAPGIALFSYDSIAGDAESYLDTIRRASFSRPAIGADGNP